MTFKDRWTAKPEGQVTSDTTSVWEGRQKFCFHYLRLPISLAVWKERGSWRVGLNYVGTSQSASWLQEIRYRLT